MSLMASMAHNAWVTSPREGQSLVTKGHTEDGFNLGGWVSYQRSVREKLTESRRRRLDEIGFVWNAN
jgi:hypothetical protein